MNDFPQLQALIAQGAKLTVVSRQRGKFHAVVYLGEVFAPGSSHWIGNSLAEAIAGLEEYVGDHEQTEQPSACKPTSPPADQWTPEQLAQFTDHTVQCRCGWWGKVSALRVLPEFKRGCPDCSAEFTPVVNMLAPHPQDKPL